MQNTAENVQPSNITSGPNIPNIPNRIGSIGATGNIPQFSSNNLTGSAK